MTTRKAQPWEPGRATAEIRAIARHPQLTISYKVHAMTRVAERGLILSDVLHALRFGNVHGAAMPALGKSGYRYLVECATPNSASREIGVVTIPDPSRWHLSVVTVMWLDEDERKAGTIMGYEDDG